MLGKQSAWTSTGCLELVTRSLINSFRRSEMTSAGSFAPNTALPATITLAPASAAWSMVPGPSPPSTSIFKFGYRFLSSWTLGNSDAMNF